MVRVLLVAMLVACGGGGSSSSSSSEGASSAASAAGKVVNIQGTVSASRAGTSRTLKAQDQVWPDDVIDTGADGSVSIELEHNNALWSLEPGIKARVDQSPAWQLDKQVAAKPVDHATSSAGRHAEREAADTTATADGEGGAASKDPQPAIGRGAPPTPTTAPAEVAAPETVERKPEPRSEPKPTTRVETKTTKPDPERKSRETQSPGGGGGGCDELSCTLDPGSACCARFGGKRKVEQPMSPPSADEPQSPDRAAIKQAIDAVRPKITACARQASVKGMLKLTIVINAEGKATQITVKESPDQKIDACVVSAVKNTLQLPRSRNGVTFSYPIILD